MERKQADTAPVLLRMENVEKRFPGVKALDRVNLTVRAGTVHALMGENGAGKSTLMKCLFGVYAKDSGTIYLEGKEIHFRNTREALENGVAMVHQELNQALKRNVMDNMWLGRFPTVARGIPLTSEKKMYTATKEIFDRLGLSVNPKTRMLDLSVSQRQMVEIAKAVSYRAKVIVFDEPTSSLTEEEVAHLFRIIRMLRTEGCGIIYISHKMKEILEISDEVTVMRDGKWIATRSAQELTTEELIRLMVGRELTQLYPPREHKVGNVLLEIQGLTAAYSKLCDVSLQAHKGEVLGIAGLDGSGRTELLETLYGLAAKRSGTVLLNGVQVRNRSPREAIQNGFAMLTEERRASGIFGILSIRDNATISSLHTCRTGPFLSNRKLHERTDWCIRSMRIKTPDQDTKIRTLSGGNQQKVILGRWLLTEPTVLLLDEPTRGIDVGAKYEIYQLILNLAATGKTVLMVSSEMPELLGVCDRIAVMSGGRLAGVLPAKTATQEEIMTLAAKFA